MERFEDFFLNDKVLKAMPWIFTVTTVIYVVMAFFSYGLESLLTTGIIDILTAVMLFALVGSYAKHEKNVMKGLMGALMAFLLVRYIDIVISSWRMTAEYIGFGLIFRSVIYSLILICFAVVFCNHFLLAREHGGSTVKIRLNQGAVIILIGLDLALIVFNIVFSAQNVVDLTDSVITFMMLIGQIAVFNAIVCIESRLNIFKTLRTEEIEGI